MLFKSIGFFVLLGIGAALGSSAVAQYRTAPDGGTVAPQFRAAPPAPKTLDCTYPIASRILTQNVPSTTGSTSFVPLPGATTSMYVGNSYGDYCIRIVFTAETGCSQTSAGDYCYVQALHNGVPLDPNGGGLQAIDSESGPAEGHAFQWATLIDSETEGQHTFSIRWRVRNAPTQFYVDDWTLSIEVLDTYSYESTGQARRSR